jgi:hypothetical protein
LAADIDRLFIVWLYLMGWSTYGLEIVSTFTPEFPERRQRPGDIRVALPSSIEGDVA